MSASFSLLELSSVGSHVGACRSITTLAKMRKADVFDSGGLRLFEEMVQSAPEWLNRCKPALAIAANTQKIGDTVWPTAVLKTYYFRD